MEYDPHKWHDNQIHGMALRTADPDNDDWTSDLILDIDHIVAWVKSEDRVRFRVAPATLTFHEVTDLRIRIDGRVTGYRAGVALPWILSIERELVADETARRERPYYDWRVVLATTPEGEITFGASGYTLDLKGEPILADEQGLTWEQRRSR